MLQFFLLLFYYAIISHSLKEIIFLSGTSIYQILEMLQNSITSFSSPSYSSPSSIHATLTSVLSDTANLYSQNK